MRACALRLLLAPLAVEWRWGWQQDHSRPRRALVQHGSPAAVPWASLFVKMRKARTRTQLGQPSESEARIAATTSRGSRESSTMTSWRQVGLERLESSSSLQRTPCALGQAAGAIVESHT